MAYAETALDIFTELTTDQALMAAVGVYKFLNSNNESPAISVLSPGQNLPDLEYTKGPEIVIHDVAEISSLYTLDVSSAQVVRYTFRVYVLLWEGFNTTTQSAYSGSDINTIVKRMLTIFGGARSVELVATPKELNVLTQTYIEIPNSAYIFGADSP